MQEGLQRWLHKWLSETSVRQALNVLNDALIVTLAAQSAIMVNSIWGLPAYP